MKNKNLQMKWIAVTILMALLLGAVGMTKANPVDMRTVREVAMKFVNANIKVQLRNEDELQLVTTYNISRGDAAFYIFNTPNGFVIVSADDCATPILGYSEEGQFDMENIPIQLQDYLQGFVEQIQYGIENHVDDETIARQWALVTTMGRLNENRDGEVVEPLITAKWSQDCYYNVMCPEDENGPCGHCFTGCVATAMAQIMHYWSYPAQGTGSHTYTPNGYPQQSVNFGETTYDWANMTDRLNGTSTQAEIDAVSTLLWHCGVAVNMGYGPCSSVAGPDLDYALTNYFDYADDMHYIHWESIQDNDLWISLLKADLNLGRPIYYVGYNPNGGHAFVCDGYDVNDRFHFNWGWGGSSNGYFALNAILYYYGQSAITGVHPNAGTIHQVTASASPSDCGTVIGAGSYDIGSICTMTAAANENYAFMYWTEDGEVVSTQAEYSFCVRKDRDLVAHFATPFYIGVMVVPEEGGTVSGAGEYAYGCTCTLTASTNEGYDFICWRRSNGNVVSTSLTYSFTVTEATTITAVFAVSGGEQIAFADLNVKAICVAHWDTNGDGEFSYAEAAAVSYLGLVFEGNTGITSFEELRYFTGLTTINNLAFYNCSNLLGSLYIPNSVTSIGNYAFYNCSNFTGDLVIPNSVTSIGYYAFYNCTGFTGSLTLGNSVTTIGDNAFSGCSGFTGCLTIGNSVTQIEGYAFYNCSSFTGDLVIPNSVTSIGNYAFYNCSNFTGDLVIPNSVTTIGDNTFSGCSGFTGSLTIGDSVTTIGNEAFHHCGFTGSLIIPNSVISIGTAAFERCGGFTGNLTIGNSVAAIGYCAFSHCSGFTGNLTIPNSVTTIDTYAFSDCTGFSNLTIGNSVTAIGYGAFNHCSGFTGNLTIPNSVTTIDTYAFSGCTGFSNLTIGNSVTAIGYGAFSHCSGFTGNLVIPNSVTEIGYHAFYGCSGFTGSLTIGNSVTKINGYAFYNCSGFTSLTIPNSVTSIGGGAFYCSGLTSIVSFIEIPFAISTTVFSAPTSIPVYVPCGTVEDYKTTGWNRFDNIIGMCSGEIEVIVNPSEGGIVTGAGYYTGGDVCVLTAIPNPGFVFVNWIENGMISTDSVYSFYAHPATIIANFCSNSPIIFADANVKAICVANWDTNGDGELSYVEAAAVTDLGEVFKNTSISSFNELQYFVNLTAIGSCAFNNCYSLTSIEIPNSVTSIGGFAFCGCRGLTSIVIPNSVTSIGDYAFQYCSGLTSIVIPNSVTSIGSYVFWRCSGLASITVLADIPPTFQNNTVFYDVDKTITVYVPCESVDAYTTANWEDFSNFVGLCGGEISITANPTAGGMVTGGGFFGIDTICILSATANTGYAFVNWTKDGVEICNSSNYRFYVAEDASYVANFVQDADIIFADSNVKSLCVANWDTNGDGELSYAEAAAVTDLGTVFKNNSNIISFVELQYFTGLTSIGSLAFCGCSGLTTIEIPSSVTSIGNSAFMYCSGLTNIEIPSSVTSIGNSAFKYCGGLTTIEIPSSVTTIDGFAFYYCDGLTTIEIPDSVTSIGQFVFSYCWSLTSLSIGSSVTSIGDYAFCHCYGLTSVEIPNSVTSIGSSAFEYCSGLTSIKIPNSVTSIDSRAFYYCIGLTSMTVLADNPPTLGNNGQDCFYDVNKSIPVYVPSGSLEAYQNASGWNEFTNIQEVCTQSQTINLSQGWNWFSTNVEITLDDLKAALVAAVPGTSITIKSQSNGSTSYNGNTWRGALNSLDVSQMYMIKVGTDCEITLVGMPVNPAEHPVTIYHGVNWIAFPLGESMTLGNAFMGFAVSGDKVKSQTTTGNYNGSLWRPSFSLVPGKGYMFISNTQQTRILTFPVSTK